MQLGHFWHLNVQCCSINIFAFCYIQKPESHTWRDQKDTEGEDYKQDVEVEDEMLLGQHDQPLDLHHHRSKTVTFHNDMVRRSCVALNIVTYGTPTFIDIQCKRNNCTGFYHYTGKQGFAYKWPGNKCFCGRTSIFLRFVAYVWSLKDNGELIRSMRTTLYLASFLCNVWAHQVTFMTFSTNCDVT